MVLPVPVAPSPNAIVYVYGEVPPVADAVNVTVWPTWGEDVETCKVEERGGIGTTVID